MRNRVIASLLTVQLPLLLTLAALASPGSALPNEQATARLAPPVPFVEPPALWYSGDVHEMIQLCHIGGYFPPDRSATDVYMEMLQTNLNVSVVLLYVAGSTTCQGYLDNYAPMVTGIEDAATLADPEYMIHFGVEVMGNDEPACLYPAWGHVAGMGLSSGWYHMDADFPSPNLDHFRFQPGALSGYAHVTWPEGTRVPEDFPPVVRELTRLYPLTAPADVAMGKASFISTPDVGHLAAFTPHPWYGLYYKLLNAGLRVSITGGTVAHCYPEMAGLQARTWVLLDSEPLTFDKWLDGIAAGRTTISDGCFDFLDVTVNGARVGDEQFFDTASQVTVEASLHVSVPRSTVLEILLDGVPVASEVVQMSSAGVHTFQTTVDLNESGWIAARTLQAHTSAIFHIVDKQPIVDSDTAAYFSAFNTLLLTYMDIAAAMCNACPTHPCVQCAEYGRWVGESEPLIRANLEQSREGFDMMAAYEQPLPAGVVRYGRSSPSCKGPIGIGFDGVPTPGALVEVTAFNAPPNSFGALAVGLAPLASPIPWQGAEIWIDPFVMPGYPEMYYTSSNGGGFAKLIAPIPPVMPDPMNVYAQFFWVNTPDCPGAGWLSSSDALHLYIQ